MNWKETRELPSDQRPTPESVFSDAKEMISKAFKDRKKGHAQTPYTLYLLLDQFPEEVKTLLEEDFVVVDDGIEKITPRGWVGETDAVTLSIFRKKGQKDSER